MEDWLSVRMHIPRPWELFLMGILLMIVVFRALLMEASLALIQTAMLLPWQRLVEPSVELPLRPLLQGALRVMVMEAAA